MAAETSNPSQIIEVAEIAWEAVTPTIKAKILWSDPATKRRAQLTRFEPGAFLSMHRHVGDELLYVIEGARHAAKGVLERPHHEAARGNGSFRAGREAATAQAYRRRATLHDRRIEFR